MMGAFTRSIGIRLATAAVAVVVSVAATSQPLLADSVDRLRGAVEPVMAKKPYRLGFAAVHFVDKFWMGMTYGMIDEAKRSGATMVSVLSAGGYGNLSQQISNIETLASSNLDGIIVAGATYDGFERTIKRVTDSGIKVVVAGTPINAKTVTVGVLEDERKVGEQMGDYICAHKPGAKVIALPGPQGSEWNKMRFEGFEAAGKKCNLQIVGGIFQGQMNLEDGQKQATDMLVKYPDADYIWAVAGLLGDGSAAAVKKLGRANVKVVSSAFTQLTTQMLKEGYMGATISEPAVLTGRLAVQYMIRALNGDPLPNTVTGVLPYPVIFSPTAPVEAKEISSYDLSQYDWPPEDWKNPFAQ
jgi:ribose transport system substrate-binding protein